MGIKIVAIAFALVGLRRVYVRYRSGGSLTLDILFWLAIWAGIAVVVFIPKRADALAQWIGVSSGFNALTFLAILGLLLSAYRLRTRLQRVERDLTRIVRAEAIARAETIASSGGAPAGGAPIGGAPIGGAPIGGAPVGP